MLAFMGAIGRINSRHHRGNFFDYLIRIQIVEQQAKLVAANPRNHVGCPGVGLQYLGQTHQQSVSRSMAMLIIDRLQSIDIKKQQCAMVAISLTSRDPVLKALNKMTTVG